MVERLPRRRWGALRPLPPLPAADGRDQRPALRAHADPPGGAAAARRGRRPRVGHRRWPTWAAARGRALNLLATTYPNSRFTGFDFSDIGLERARSDATANGSTNVTFVAKDAAKLDDVERFDVVTSFDAIHDQAHPDAVLAGIHRALRPGGTYLCVEPKASSHLHENYDLPMAALLYTVSTMHCMTVSLAYDGEGPGRGLGRAGGPGAAGQGRFRRRRAHRRAGRPHEQLLPGPEGLTGPSPAGTKHSMSGRPGRHRGRPGCLGSQGVVGDDRVRLRRLQRQRQADGQGAAQGGPARLGRRAVRVVRCSAAWACAPSTACPWS